MPSASLPVPSQTLGQAGPPSQNPARVAETVTALDWAGFGGPRVGSVTHTPDTAAPGTTHVSTYRHDANGTLAEVQIQDGRPRTVTYVTDVQGQVLSRAQRQSVTL